MSEETPDPEAFAQLLLARRAELVGDCAQMARDAGVGKGGPVEAHGQLATHMADAASDTYDQEMTVQRLSSSNLTLQEIDEALDRIAAGTFGRCEECDAAIPLRRLKIKPHASLCIECQRREETA